jgi:uncharacterized RDD family membrane protein YckC
MPAAADVALDLTVPNLSSGVTPVARGSGPLDGKIHLRIDHFVVDRKIGAGGMGAIYAARDVALDRAVALKVLTDDVAREPGAHERFIREAQAQARLSSPHVVQIFYIGRLPADLVAAVEDRDVERDDGEREDLAASAHGPLSDRGSLYFAMEYVDGDSLAAILVRGDKLDPESARKLMIQAARGLEDAYEAGIVHRDVKPANLLVTRTGILKIADFGLAKPRDPTLALTAAGAVMGTPYYMAPEQAGAGAVDHRADIYALGCSFYHLLTGETPFDGPSPVIVLAHHQNTEPRPLRELEPKVRPELAAILARMMKKDPAQRFPTYEALVAALEAAAPTRVEPAGFWTRAIATGIDGVLASALIGFFGWVGLLVHIAYVTVAQAYFGQTIAKYLLRIRVERTDGTRLGLKRSLARVIAAMWLPFWFGIIALAKGFASFKDSVARLADLSAAKELIVPLVVGNGFLFLLYAASMIVAALDPQKRAAHDHLLGSRVVYRLGPHRLTLLPTTKPHRRFRRR